MVKEVTPKAQALIDAFFPGPLTIILPKSDLIGKVVSGGLDTVAVRMPINEVANKVIKAAGCPIAAPSANTSGLPSPTRAKYVIDDMSGKIEAIIDGGDCEFGVESTVITLATDIPTVLRPGAVTKEMLEEIKAKGVNIGYVTLHVGLGTFRPVKVDDVTKHTMHTEHYIMPQETADLINETKKNGKRVISVGTTSCRTLESVATKNGCICADEDDTSIFIYPGYEFKCIDALVTNFHLPESTLIMLISAFAGYDHVMNAYKIAVDEKYRFFSFGDAMFIC